MARGLDRPSCPGERERERETEPLLRYRTLYGSSQLLTYVRISLPVADPSPCPREREREPVARLWTYLGHRRSARAQGVGPHDPPPNAQQASKQTSGSPLLLLALTKERASGRRDRQRGGEASLGERKKERDVIRRLLLHTRTSQRQGSLGMNVSFSFRYLFACWSFP